MQIQSRSTGNKTPTTLAEINVTPLVDVMLVLLIVFMVCAPLMQQGIQVDLPKSGGQALDQPNEQIVLVIHSNQKLTINDNTIAPGTLSRKLAAIYDGKQNKEIFIQADQAVNYGFVAHVMAEVKRAGITKVGLVTDSAKEGSGL